MHTIKQFNIYGVRVCYNGIFWRINTRQEKLKQKIINYLITENYIPKFKENSIFG